MAVPARRLLPRAERQEAILRAAAVAFACGGFAGTSMDQVAAQCGVTRLIVYRNFGSKEDLYRAVLQRVSDRVAEEFVDRLERGEKGQGLGVRTLLTVAREDPDAFRLLWRQSAREPGFADYAEQLRAGIVDAARNLLSGAGDRTIERWAAQAVVGFLVEAVLAWLDEGTPRRDADFAALVATGVQALRRAWT